MFASARIPYEVRPCLLARLLYLTQYKLRILQALGTWNLTLNTETHDTEKQR